MLERHRDRFRVVALTAYGSAELLVEQARRTGAGLLGLVQEQGGRKIETLELGARVRLGPDALVEAATHPEVRIVINAVVGRAGLEATLAALRAGKRVALANKEALVMAGDLVLRAAREGGGEIVPVDSEHSAILQCTAGASASAGSLRRLILTASGGPFRDWPREKLSEATVHQALQHPTWRMGRKITVDSATLANKALEVIEAHFLFGLDYDAIEVVVHPQSVVHALTEFVDGSVLAQVGFPNMELPILYALTYPERVPDNGAPRFDPVAVGVLTFEPLRKDAFPAFELGVQAGRRGGTAPAVFNAANEVAVRAFLEGRLSFSGIPRVIECVLSAHDPLPASELPAVLEADRWARELAESCCP